MRGKLYVAIKKHNNGYMFRVGYSKRGLYRWLKTYKDEGFKTCHVHEISVVKCQGKTLKDARELLLYKIAVYLEQQHAIIDHIGEYKQYAYLVNRKKYIREAVQSVGNVLIWDEVKNEPKAEPAKTCIVM